MSPDYVLRSWLIEFGYMHAAGGDVRVAFRMARDERGADRLRRELSAQEWRGAWVQMAGRANRAVPSS